MATGIVLGVSFSRDTQYIPLYAGIILSQVDAYLYLVPHVLIDVLQVDLEEHVSRLSRRDADAFGIYRFSSRFQRVKLLKELGTSAPKSEQRATSTTQQLPETIGCHLLESRRTSMSRIS